MAWLWYWGTEWTVLQTIPNIQEECIHAWQDIEKKDNIIKQKCCRCYLERFVTL
jgi:hypothetical protein